MTVLNLSHYPFIITLTHPDSYLVLYVGQGWEVTEQTKMKIRTKNKNKLQTIICTKFKMYGQVSYRIKCCCQNKVQ